MPLEIIDQLLPDRAGRGGNQNKAIQLHIQDGYGNPFGYFQTVAADCTIWNPRQGKMRRYLKDGDLTWTNGLWVEPLNRNIKFVRDYAYTIYPGNLLLTVENEGKPGDVLTVSQFNNLVDLCDYWCNLYQIPRSRDYIIKHSDAGDHKYCPGTLIDYDKLIAAVRARASVPTTPTKTPGGDVMPFQDPITGFWVTAPFAKFYAENGGLRIFGRPIGWMRTDDPRFPGILIQDFERLRMELHPGETEIKLGLSNRELLTVLGR